MSQHKYDYLFKILLMGDSTDGNTAFLLKYTDDSFIANQITTIGIDFKIKYIKINDKSIKLQIWDTAVLERYRDGSKTYYKAAHGIILLYDVADQNSFKNIPNMINQIELNAPNIKCKVLGFSWK